MFSSLTIAAARPSLIFMGRKQHTKGLQWETWHVLRQHGEDPHSAFQVFLCLAFTCLHAFMSEKKSMNCYLHKSGEIPHSTLIPSDAAVLWRTLCCVAISRTPSPGHSNSRAAGPRVEERSLLLVLLEPTFEPVTSVTSSSKEA